MTCYSILYRDVASPGCRLPGGREGDWMIVGADLFSISEETQVNVNVVLIWYCRLGLISEGI